VASGRFGKPSRFLQEQWTDISSIDAGLEPYQRSTLELGAFVVLIAVGVGVQVGGWPLWSLFCAGVGYVCWVVVYSEATLQASRLHLQRRARRREPAA
jgi:hypothetical protein